ncbi:MAG: phage baseplate assembly protein V [Candidatus Competibacteraceae bacterium]|nr:phage baseplate assembly protein V [Candidatus Competibacteraceae bacterium]
MSQLFLDEEFDSRLALGYGGRFYGVYTALVTDIVDPEGQGRVKIRLPWSPDGDGGDYLAWARLATLMGGHNRGSWFIPDEQDEVLVVFEAGDTRRPYVIGGLWNGQDSPPESMDSAGNNPLKTLRSRNGVKITLDDSDGQERLHLETPGGQQLTLSDGPGTIEIADSNGNTLTLESSGITLNAAAKLTIQAATMEVSAGMVTVNAGLSKFSGVVQADTVITNAVISSSYTPGAGNFL